MCSQFESNPDYSTWFNEKFPGDSVSMWRGYLYETVRLMSHGLHTLLTSNQSVTDEHALMAAMKAKQIPAITTTGTYSLSDTGNRNSSYYLYQGCGTVNASIVGTWSLASKQMTLLPPEPSCLCSGQVDAAGAGDTCRLYSEYALWASVKWCYTDCSCPYAKRSTESGFGCYILGCEYKLKFADGSHIRTPVGTST